MSEDNDWLGDLPGIRQLFRDGVAFVRRKAVDFIGTGWTVVDNPATGRTEVSLVIQDIAGEVAGEGSVLQAAAAAAVQALETGVPHARLTPPDDETPALTLESAGVDGGITRVLVGTRDPNGVIVAPRGTLYLREVNRAEPSFFINISNATPTSLWAPLLRGAPGTMEQGRMAVADGPNGAQRFFEDLTYDNTARRMRVRASAGMAGGLQADTSAGSARFFAGYDPTEDRAVIEVLGPNQGRVSGTWEITTGGALVWRPQGATFAGPLFESAGGSLRGRVGYDNPSARLLFDATEAVSGGELRGTILVVAPSTLTVPAPTADGHAVNRSFVNSGNYTPTFSNPTNVSFDALQLAFWERIGNRVGVHLRFTGIPASVGAISIEATLPPGLQPPNFSSSADVVGHGTWGLSSGTGRFPVRVDSVSGTTRVEIIGEASGTTNRSCLVSFWYDL